MRRLLFTFTFGLFFFLPACAGIPDQNATVALKAPLAGDEVIARVNNDSITYQEWANAYEQQLSKKEMSAEQFLDEYINYKLGVQRAEKLHLHHSPYVQFQIDQFLYAKFLKEEYRQQGSQKPFEEWKKGYVQKVLNGTDVWISPTYLSLGLSVLAPQAVLVKIKGEKVTVATFRRLNKKSLSSGKSADDLLEKYILFKVIVSEAKSRGWEHRPAYKFAKEKILFDMANKVELGSRHLDPKWVRKMYEIERRKADVEVYSSAR